MKIQVKQFAKKKIEALVKKDTAMPFFFVGDSDFVTNFLHLITEM